MKRKKEEKVNIMNIFVSILGYFFHKIIFLLIICELHTLHPNHTCFPLPQISPYHTHTPKFIKSSSCHPYTHCVMVKLPMAIPSTPYAQKLLIVRS